MVVFIPSNLVGRKHNLRQRFRNAFAVCNVAFAREIFHISFRELSRTYVFADFYRFAFAITRFAFASHHVAGCIYNKHIHSGMMQKVKGCRFDSHRRARQLGSSCFLAEHAKPKILYIWHARVDIFFYQVSSFHGAFASFREPFAKIGLHFEFLLGFKLQGFKLQNQLLM